MRNNLIKIFIGYHKPDFLIKSNIFEPIFLGREIYTQETKDGYITDSGFSFLSENMLQDNIGFNISHLNRYFCELTGIYWIWKNYSNLYNLDYIGFMHYRRHFISKDLSSFLKLDSDARYSYIINKIDYTYIKYINDFLKDKIECDLIIPYMFDFKKSLFHEINIEEFFCRQHGLTNASFKTLEYIIKYKYPDYYDIFIEFSKGTAYYPCNMFIMKKELFCKYCTFLFDIMFSLFDIFEEMLKNLDSLWEKRNLAWISEFVSTLFFLKYIRDNHNNVEFLPISFVQNTIENKMV
ncbi:glycosyl transferase, partial [Campylobacter jejuni subsp. jejuni]